ncbi:MAG: DUF1554 domain-containing protein [bacterium]|nr:DUF1554 domain-containing protein [bacterium]
MMHCFYFLRRKPEIDRQAVRRRFGLLALGFLICTSGACAVADSSCSGRDGVCHPDLSFLLYTQSTAATVAASAPPCEDQGFCYMYSATNAATGWSGSAVGGIPGADAKCLAEVPGGLPAGSQYRAMLMAAGVRTQSLDWTLQPSMEYRLQDGTTVVGVTNSAAVLDFPLTNAFGAFFNMWTGFTRTNATTWTPGNDCVAWTAITLGSSGARNNTATNFIENDPNRPCGSAAGLYCVQQ